MATPTEFVPEKLIIPLLFRPELPLAELRATLEAHLGRVEHVSDPFPFDFTDYYESEMGSDLRRAFVWIEPLTDPARLAEVKRITNEIEEQYARNGRRRINADPGLLSLGRFVLATTKDFAHRIPLHDGIYAEVTLLYRNKDYVPLPWTYPDYRSRAYRDELLRARARYRKQLKHRG
jgi:hypothetical protein